MHVQVLNVHEETGPLGGVSYVYTVHVKSSNSGESCILDYTVGRTFAEFVDMHNKLRKQFSKTGGIPVLSKHLCGRNVSCDERLKALDILMTKLSSNTEQMDSYVINDFLQIEKNRKLVAEQKSGTALPVKPCADKEIENTANIAKESIPLIDDYLKEYENETDKVSFHIDSKKQIDKTQSKKKSNVRPQTTSQKSNQDTLPKLKKDLTTKNDEEDQDLFLPSKLPAATIDIDIFEEFYTSKSSQSQLIIPEKTNLFNEVNTDDEDLFNPDEKPTDDIEEAPPFTEKIEPFQRSKNPAKINLFDDVDLGDRVFKDEHHLFYIPDEEVEKETVSDVIPDDDEDAKDLLNVDNSLNDIFDILKIENQNSSANTIKKFPKPTPTPRTKPIPTPRKLSFNQGDQTDEKNTKKNDTNEKPNLLPKPLVAAKPVKPPKPSVKPPVPCRPITAMKPASPPKINVSSKSVKSTTLSHVDINQYITQQISTEDEVNLFD